LVTLEWEQRKTMTYQVTQAEPSQNPGQQGVQHRLQATSAKLTEQRSFHNSFGLLCGHDRGEERIAEEEFDRRLGASLHNDLALLELHNAWPQRIFEAKVFTFVGGDTGEHSHLVGWELKIRS
jgi:hypothetical protein